MVDRYRSFSELSRREREGEDWAREYVDRGSRILVMAPHGGWIEPFTAELARAVAGEELSFYAFQGLNARGNRILHVTSHRFDEPLALEATSSARWVLAIHGERDAERPFVMVGGLWASFRERMTRAFQEAGVPVKGPRRGLGGVHPKNICNRGRAGRGGQLEISEALRSHLRRDPRALADFAEVVRGVLLEAEARRPVGVSRGR